MPRCLCGHGESCEFCDGTYDRIKKEVANTGWLIERTMCGMVKWWAGGDTLTTDPSIAIRFCRERDALNAIKGACWDHPSIQPPFKATEHRWM